VPAAGALFLLPVVVVQVWPLPDYPVSLTPFLFLAMMLVGFVAMMIVEARRPGTLACPGAVTEAKHDRESSPPSLTE